MKALSYFYVKCSPRVPLHLLTVEKIERENFDVVVLLLLSSSSSSFFFFSLMHNSKSIRHIQTNHTPSDCSTLKDLPFFGQSCMQANIDELWPQTHVAQGFLYTILCVITRTTQKLKIVQGRFTYRTIALLLEMSILFVRTVCEIPSASYGSKHASQALSGTTFVRPYTRNSNTTGRMLTFYMLNDCSTIGNVCFLCQSWI